LPQGVGEDSALGFQLVREDFLTFDQVANAEITELWQYWERKRATHRLPSRDDIDPYDLKGQLGRLHILDVKGPSIFRYRLYGSRVTNPGRRDMTGQTTMAYADQEFAEMVTRHLRKAVDTGQPACFDIEAKLYGQLYAYTRAAFPLATDHVTVDKLLVGTQRKSIPTEIER
tara:strand:- start:382 stop:897 length:516 start_codon:yes stop_codon:yes gene_type:complete